MVREGIQEERGAGAPRDNISAGAGYYECADGEGVYLFTAGQSTTKKAVEFFGLEYGCELFPEGIPSVGMHSTPGATVFDRRIETYAPSTRPRSLPRPCPGRHSLLGGHELRDDGRAPHYLARDTWVEWDTVDGKT